MGARQHFAVTSVTSNSLQRLFEQHQEHVHKAHKLREEEQSVKNMMGNTT